MLGEEDQLTVYNRLRDLLFPNVLPSVALIDDLKEKRFHKGLNCPHCGSDHVNRRGTYRGRHRYSCKACQRTFNDMTATPMAGSHLLEKWRDYIECMIKGLPLRKIGEVLEISLSTAFTWRHKVLNALREMAPDGFKGVLEVDETFMLHSEKGSRDLVGRKPRKRGGKSPKRGISNDQDCILVARDRTGQTLAQLACLGRISMRQAMTVLEGTLREVTTLCSDAHGSWSAVAKAEDLPHVALNASKGQRVKDIYHIQNANAFHRRLKQWLERFNGVASKFLDNYLVWFCFLDEHSSEVMNARRDGLLSASFMNPTHETYRAIRNTKFALPT
jgi:transposase-like protein